MIPRRLTVLTAALAVISVPAIAANEDPCEFTWLRDGSDVTSQVTCPGAEAGLPEPMSVDQAEPCDALVAARGYLVGELTASRVDAGSPVGKLQTEISPTGDVHVTAQTHRDIARATLTLRAEDLSFVTDSDSGFVTPDEDGERVVGIGPIDVSEDGRELTVAIADMPNGSSLAFDIRVDRAGERPAIAAELRGSVRDCSATAPESVAHYTAWNDQERRCEAGTMLQVREAEVRDYVWDQESASWELGPTETRTEERTRDLSRAEIAECPERTTRQVSDWRDIRRDCVTSTVEQQREMTSSRDVWDPVDREWTRKDSVAVESRYRDMSAEEIRQCAVEPSRQRGGPILTLKDLMTWGR